MAVSGPERVIHRPCTTAPPPRRLVSPDGRLWLSLRAALVAVQVACLTVVGWIGATLTLLPVALRGAPVGRKVWPREPHLVRILEPAPPHEALPR